MSRLGQILIPLWAVVYLPLAWGESAIEGTVRLPASGTEPMTPSRYANVMPGRVGAPDPPMAVVYLEGNFPAGNSPRVPPARMEQKHYQFSPGLLPIQAGTEVVFPNLDDGYHNVFSYSKARRFDLGRYRKDEKPPVLVFDKPGVVKLYCEIHQHMRGTILVLDTPYYVKTDEAGKYRLEHLPPGQFTLKAWLDEAQVWSRQVDLTNGAVLHVDFTRP